MDPSAIQMEQKLPEGSETKEIQENNKALSDLLTSLHILEENNSEHPSIQERKKITKNSKVDVKALFDGLKPHLQKKHPNYQKWAEENANLWINEDNLPTDENWNPLSPAEM